MNVTGESSRNMFINYAFPRFQLLQQSNIFQQDDAPSQYADRVGDYLSTESQDDGT